MTEHRNKYIKMFLCRRQNSSCKITHNAKFQRSSQFRWKVLATVVCVRFSKRKTTRYIACYHKIHASRSNETATNWWKIYLHQKLTWNSNIDFVLVPFGYPEISCFKAAEKTARRMLFNINSLEHFSKYINCRWVLLIRFD